MAGASSENQAEAGSEKWEEHWEHCDHYDDDDLFGTTPFVLLAPSGGSRPRQAFIWREHNTEQEGAEGVLASLMRWLATRDGQPHASFVNGQHGGEAAVSPAAVELGGEESEAFWSLFDAGL